MLTKLDATLLVAWLASGAMALENRGRVDVGVPERAATARPICHVVLGPPESRPASFGPRPHIEIETPVAELVLRCEQP